MKASQKDFARIAQRAAQTARIFYFCGPDEAGAADAMGEIIAMLRDPGERVELTGAELRRDPVRLGDEARSTSLFGDTRHIVVRAQGDDAHDAVEILLSSDVPACPVLIIAAGATDKSRIAKLLGDRPDALVAMFYPPDLRAIAGRIRIMANGAGLRMGDEMTERIARAAGMDIRLAQSEVIKLALYLDASPERPRTAEAAALDAVGAATEEDGFGAIVHVVLAGKWARIPAELRRISEMGLSAVGVLLALERRAAQLVQLAGKLDSRGDVAALIESEKAARRIFWKDASDIAEELNCWRGPRITRLVEKLMNLHRSLLTNSQDGEVLLAQGLAEVARAASRGR